MGVFSFNTVFPIYSCKKKKISPEVYDRIKYLFSYLGTSIIIDSKGSRCLLLGLDWDLSPNWVAHIQRAFPCFIMMNIFKCSSNEHRSYFFLQNSNPVFPLAILLYCFYFLLVFWPSYPHRYIYFHCFSWETSQCTRLYFHLLFLLPSSVVVSSTCRCIKDMKKHLVALSA